MNNDEKQSNNCEAYKELHESSAVLNENDEDHSLSEFADADLSDNPLIMIIDKAMNFPGVRVNRTAFLIDIYQLSGTDVDNKSVSELVSLQQMDTAAKKYITTNVTQSSVAAFALGLPGGIAMAATIPADVMQNFAFSLRLAQQLAYIYGFDNLVDDNGKMDDKAKHTLIAFFGIMFAATGSGSVLRAIAPNVGKYAARQALQKPLTKTVWYPLLKKIANVVASKTITKKSVAGFASKAIPVVGGVFSAGINIAVMIPMANRLKNELRKYHLSDDEIQKNEENDKIEFGDKASDVISDVAAGSIKVANKVKGIGQDIGKFAKQISDKTKEKLDK